MQCLLRKMLLTLSVVSFGTPFSTQAGEPYDRSQWIDPGTATSDDLRRVPQPPSFGDHDGNIVLVGGRLFDGTGQPARPATLVVQGKRISAVLAPENKNYPGSAEVVDVAGATVMPGLIDMHVHTTYLKQWGLPAELASRSQADAALRGLERLRYYLESGVTTVVDTGSHGMAPFILSKYIAEGSFPGPRIFAAGQLIVGRGGHRAEGFIFETAPEYDGALIREASGADDWREAVREQFKRGANLIKLASHYTPDELRAAIEEAHRLGLRVTVDAETQYIDMAIDAGADSIEHLMPRSDEAIARMAKEGVAAIPTVWILNTWIDLGGGGYWGSTSRRFTTSEKRSMDLLQRLKDAGVKMGVGTDLILSLYKMMPGPYIEELKSFQAVGYSAAQALVAATRINAEILGIEDKLGTLEAGKLADIIVVNGRPDQNIEDLANVEMVIVNGQFKVRQQRLFVPRHDVTRDVRDLRWMK